MDLRTLVLLSFFTTATAQLSLSTTGGVKCYGEQVTLLCTHPALPQEPEYLQTEVSWRRDGNGINVGGLGRTNPNYTTTKLEFTITNSTVGNYTCFLVNAVQGGVDETNSMTAGPPEQPMRPVIAPVPTSPPYMLSWTHDKRCFNHHTFTYHVRWMDTSSDPSSSGGANTTERQYDLSVLPPGEYSVGIQAVCNENSSIISGVGSTQINIPTPTAPTDPNVGGPDNTLTIVIIVVVIVVVVLIVAIIIAVVTICVCRNKPKVTQTDMEGKEPPTNPSKKDLYGQVEYVKVYISNDRPCKPPRIPDVEYTEAMGVGQKVKTPPPDPLPPKKGVKRYIKPDPFKSNELKMKVVAILQRRKIVHGSLEPDEAVVGTYQNKTFVANFVYFEDDRWDVPEREIDEMVKTRDHQGADKGLLVTNMETIPSNLLEKLEKRHCHFIGVGRIEQLNENALMKKFGLFFTSEK